MLLPGGRGARPGYVQPRLLPLSFLPDRPSQGRRPDLQATVSGRSPHSSASCWATSSGFTGSAAGALLQPQRFLFRLCLNVRCVPGPLLGCVASEERAEAHRSGGWGPNARPVLVQNQPAGTALQHAQDNTRSPLKPVRSGSPSRRHVICSSRKRAASAIEAWGRVGGVSGGRGLLFPQGPWSGGHQDKLHTVNQLLVSLPRRPESREALAPLTRRHTASPVPASTALGCPCLCLSLCLPPPPRAEPPATPPAAQGRCVTKGT